MSQAAGIAERATRLPRACTPCGGPDADTDRFQLLFGPYKAPRFRVGKVVRCEVWGEVRIVGLSEGCIPWPVGISAAPGFRASVVDPPWGAYPELW